MTRIAILFALSMATMAAEEEPGVSWGVRLEVQMIRIDAARALTFVPRLKEDATRERAYEELQLLVRQDEAELLAWNVVHAKAQTPTGTTVQRSLSGPENSYLFSSRTGLTETIEERRYPTDFEPPQAAEPFSPRQPKPWLLAKGSVPTSFETRDLGPSVRIEATVSGSGELITLDISPQFVRLVGFQNYQRARSIIGIEGVMAQPAFHTTRTTGHVTTKSGVRFLLAAAFVQTPYPGMEIFLGRAVATKTPNPPTESPDK